MGKIKASLEGPGVGCITEDTVAGMTIIYPAPQTPYLVVLD